MLKKICEAAQIKLKDEGAGSFSGYGSTFHNSDRVGDVIAPGAFAKSLARFVQDGVVPIGHDWSGLPVATISNAYEDEKGLFIEADFHSTPEAQAARTVVKERLERGKSVGLSIGFDIKDSERTKSGRVIKEIDLWECSLVQIPCNPKASATEAKGTEAKGEYLGSYVEADMTWSAIRSVNDALYWVLQECLFYGEGTLPERLAKVEGALNEFRDLVLSTIQRLAESVQGDEEAQKAMAAEVKTLWPEPFATGEDAPPAGAPLAQQIDTALAAVADCIDRAQAVKDLREQEGRTLSPERRAQLADLIAKAQQLHEATRPKVDDAILLRLKAEHLARVARARATTLPA